MEGTSFNSGSFVNINGLKKSLLNPWEKHQKDCSKMGYCSFKKGKDSLQCQICESIAFNPREAGKVPFNQNTETGKAYGWDEYIFGWALETLSASFPSFSLILCI